MTMTDLDRRPLAEPQRPVSLSALQSATLVFLVAFLCYLPLPTGSPLAGTEGHRALTAHQMVESGEWLVPRLFGRVYLRKPPLHYWLEAAAESITGHATPFVWRLPGALEGALLAAALSLFASRWFGGIAGLISGFGCLSLVALWGQERSADIDVTDTLSSTLAALCIVELNFGSGKRQGAWIIAAGAAFGASLMAKGPGGFPIILAALIWAGIVFIREKRPARFLSPEYWLPVAIGIAVFGIYAVAVYRYLNMHHLPLDLSGLEEGSKDLHPHDWSWQRAKEWLLQQPTMFFCSIPVSAALPLSFNRQVRDGARNQRVMSALAGSVLVAWTICFLSGMHKPRYEYVTLPLLCPLAGAVAMRVPAMRQSLQRSVRNLLIATVMIFGALAAGLSVMLWRHHEIRVELACTTLVGIALAAILARALWMKRGNWQAAWGLPVLMVIAAANMALFGHYDRLKRSGLDQGLMLRSIAGEQAELVGCKMVLDQPEVFYYSGLKTRAVDGAALNWRDVQSGTWVVLASGEFETWTAEVPGRLKRVVPFVTNKNQGYLIWYAE